MIVFQVSPNFDPAKKVPKIWCQIYIFMNKVIILRKIQARMKTFNSAFMNHFSLSLNREKRVVMRAMKKKLPKHSFADLLLKIGVLKNFASFTGKHLGQTLLNKVAVLLNLRNFTNIFFYRKPPVFTYKTKHTHASAVNLLDIRMGNLDWNESHVKETDSADDLLQQEISTEANADIAKTKREKQIVLIVERWMQRLLL